MTLSRRRTTIAAVAGDDAKWLSTQEAARRLGITSRTLYRFIDEGAVPAYKLGRVLRLKAEDIDAYLETVRIKPGELRHLYPGRVGSENDGDG